MKLGTKDVIVEYLEDIKKIDVVQELPLMTLGLTAAPERADGEKIMNLFKNEAHKLDL